METKTGFLKELSKETAMIHNDVRTVALDFECTANEQNLLSWIESCGLNSSQ